MVLQNDAFWKYVFSSTDTPAISLIQTCVYYSWFIDDYIKKNKDSKERLTKLKSKVTDWANKQNFPLESRTKAMKARDKKVVCRTFHGAGLVVPVDANDVGYREVPETPGEKFCFCLIT